MGAESPPAGPTRAKIKEVEKRTNIVNIPSDSETKPNCLKILELKSLASSFFGLFRDTDFMH